MQPYSPELCTGTDSRMAMIKIDEERFDDAIGELTRRMERGFDDQRKRLDQLEDKLDRQYKVADCLSGDRWLDNQDLCLMLKISKRTLARYRQ